MNTSKMLSVLGLFWICLASPNAVAAQLTQQQRQIADDVVGTRIATIQQKVAEDANLRENLEQLAQRRREWGGWKPAMRIGFCVKRCRQRHVPIPALVDKRVVGDIIWQYENAYGDGNSLKYHREECARALGFIAHPHGLAVIMKSLHRESGHFSWQGLEEFSDARLIPVIEEKLDFTCQQDALPAIRCLGNIGSDAIPALTRVLERDDRALDRAVTEALIQIQMPDCIPALESLANSSDTRTAHKAEAGIQMIRSRAIDKIYSPPTWNAGDDARLFYLTTAALFEDEEISTEAVDALLRLGEPSIYHLRKQLPNYTHSDTINGAVFYVSKKAAGILVQVGSPAVPALIDALCDEYGHARQFACEALREITGEDIRADYESWKSWYLTRGKQSRTEQ